jgi:ApaG protein
MPDTKHEITVEAQAVYIPDQSDADKRRYVFAYRIKITNTGTIITDANGRVEEVKGDGVVGEQPLLHPNESFEYTSGTAIATPVGSMRGSYQMVADDGMKFDAPIPEFTLAMPRMLH